MIADKTVGVLRRSASWLSGSGNVLFGDMMGKVNVVQQGNLGSSAPVRAAQASVSGTPDADGCRPAGNLVLCLDPLAMRPATIRRQQRMHALVAELATRDMDTTAVAVFLDCSPTCARNYLNELIEAAVIRSRRCEQAEGGIRSGYCLQSEAAAGKFLAHLDAAQSPRVKLKRGGKPTTEARSFGSRHFHIIADDRFLEVSTSDAAIRRDPLVAALFGKETTPRDALALGNTRVDGLRRGDR